MQIARCAASVLIATVGAACVFAQEKAKPTRDECKAQLSRALDEMAEAGFSGSVLVAGERGVRPGSRARPCPRRR